MINDYKSLTLKEIRFSRAVLAEDEIAAFIKLHVRTHFQLLIREECLNRYAFDMHICSVSLVVCVLCKTLN